MAGVSDYCRLSDLLRSRSGKNIDPRYSWRGSPVSHEDEGFGVKHFEHLLQKSNIFRRKVIIRYKNDHHIPFLHHHQSVTR
jgi:hypothetical protein